MDEKTMKKIWDLYFEEMYDYEDIINYFKGKYTHKEIKSAINKRYEKMQKTYF